MITPATPAAAEPTLLGEQDTSGRREFLKLLGLGSALPLLPLLPRPGALHAAAALTPPPVGASIYERMLGVRPFINAAGPVTGLGGTLMPKEVTEAMAEAARNFVDMNELNLAAGAHLAKILKAEAAMVTSGAFGAMVLGAAACLTGEDPEKIAALPHPTWPRRELVLQKAQSTGYDRAYRNAGMTIVYVETEAEMLAAVSERTAMIAGLINVEKWNRPELIRPERLIAIGRRAGVPVYLDASFTANQVPPVSKLWRYTELGADLVGISGGKGLHGPQSTGILAGRADLIAAARAQASPSGGLGRGMKVDKEEIVGLLVAVERFVALDHEALVRRHRKRVDTMRERLHDIPGLCLNYDEFFFGPGLVLLWNETDLPLSYAEFGRRMREGEPSIAVAVFPGSSLLLARHGGEPTLFTAYLKDGEEKTVARRAREILLAARA